MTRELYDMLEQLDEDLGPRVCAELRHRIKISEIREYHKGRMDTVDLLLCPSPKEKGET